MRTLFRTVALNGQPDCCAGFLTVDSLEQQRQGKCFLHFDDRQVSMINSICNEVASTYFSFDFVTSFSEKALDWRVKFGFKLDGHVVLPPPISELLPYG